MRVTSSAFEQDEMIPERYTCDGNGVSPPLSIEGIPDGAATLALIVEDPDAPRGVFDHWVAYDIPPLGEIPEAVDALGVPGVGTSGQKGYHPPCPPSGTHRYQFKILALDATLALPDGADKRRFLEAAVGHVLAEATLTGRYSR